MPFLEVSMVHNGQLEGKVLPGFFETNATCIADRPHYCRHGDEGSANGQVRQKIQAWVS
jgi:hypothetical protein